LDFHLEDPALHGGGPAFGLQDVELSVADF
jgi:hypothetical protein